MRVLLSLVFLMTNLAVAQEPTQEPGRAVTEYTALELPPLHMGTAVVSVPYPILQTGFQQDTSGTVYLVTQLANGHKEKLRISNFGAVRQLLLYDAWPYVLTYNGKLYALDVSAKTLRKAKLTSVWSRMVGKFPYAAAAGLGVAVLSWFNLAIHGGAPTHYASLEPATYGLSAFLGFYLIDAGLTLYWRTPHQMGRGGNLFRREVARKVIDVTQDKLRNDFAIKVKGLDRPVYLSTLVPDFARESSCIYSLTKLNME